MHRFIFIALIFTLALYSCGIGIPLEEMRPVHQIAKLSKVKNLVHDEVDELVFDMSIKFINTYHSGILAFSKANQASGCYRTVFMAKAGVKLFDFEFSPDSMKINSIIDQLDKKIVLQILERDLRMIFDEVTTESNQYYQLKTSGDLVMRSTSNKDILHYYIDRQGYIFRIDKGSKYKSVVRLDIEYDEHNWPQRIFIQHKKIPFLMRLSRLASVN